MNPLAAIPSNPARPPRPGAQRSRRDWPSTSPGRQASPETDNTPGQTRNFTSLIDAKAAGVLLSVPHSWLLAQARAGRIPHHRLGHYVRFNPEDLHDWLRETRSMPTASPQPHRRRA